MIVTTKRITAASNRTYYRKLETEISGERRRRMDSFLYNKRLQAPICTGNPWEIQKQEQKKEEPEVSFKEILEQKISEESKLSFSKHAVNRVVERNVDVSSANLERLNEGVRLAEEKGLKEPLILVDSTAYVVNLKNNKVVTVVSDESLKGAIFTNIDGTVMI